MVRQLSLQKAAEVESPVEGPIGRCQRQQTVRVDRFELDVEPPGRPLYHARQEETRKLVGHDDGGTLGERGQEPLAGTPFGLDIRVVADPGALQSRLVVAHSVEDEAVEAVTRPGVV